MSAPLSPPPKSLQASLLPQIWAVERGCLLSELSQLRYIVHIHQSWRRPGCPSARTPLGRGLQRCFSDDSTPNPSPPEVAQSCPVGSPSLLPAQLLDLPSPLGQVTAPTVRVTQAGVCLDGRGLSPGPYPAQSGLAAQEHVSVTAGLPEYSVASDLIPRAPSLPPGPRHHSPHCFFFPFLPFLSGFSLVYSMLEPTLGLAAACVPQAVTSGLVASRHPALEMT